MDSPAKVSTRFQSPRDAADLAAFVELADRDVVRAIAVMRRNVHQQVRRRGGLRRQLDLFERVRAARRELEARAPPLGRLGLEILALLELRRRPRERLRQRMRDLEHEPPAVG